MVMTGLSVCLCGGQVTWERNTHKRARAPVTKQSGFKISLDPLRFCERIRTFARHNPLMFLHGPSPSHRCACKLKTSPKKRVKVRDGRTNEGGWRISAPHMRLCIEERPGIIRDNHSISLSLPITLGRGLSSAAPPPLSGPTATSSRTSCPPLICATLVGHLAREILTMPGLILCQGMFFLFSFVCSCFFSSPSSTLSKKKKKKTPAIARRTQEVEPYRVKT